MSFVKKYYKWISLEIILGLVIGSLLFWQLFFRSNDRPNTLPKIDLKETNITIKIPKLNIKAPIIENVDPSDETEYNQALTKGVALMPSPGIVGKSGNVIIYGHSSAKEAGPYQYIFAGLNDLNVDDEIKIYNKGELYIYKVTNKKVIEATDFSILKQTEKETLTLFTCWPIGTDEKRLVIIAIR